MEALKFAPHIDLPLVAIVVIGFVLSFHFGGEQSDSDSMVDLGPRLPRAYFRLFLLFGILLLICWLANLGVYVLLLVLLATGVIGIILCGDEAALGLIMYLSFGMVREWCLGFPNLVLDPNSHQTVETPKLLQHAELVGCHAITTSPLRPSGEVKIDDKEFSAVSENGKLIESGVAVTIVGERNGQLCVRDALESGKSSA